MDTNNTGRINIDNRNWFKYIRYQHSRCIMVEISDHTLDPNEYTSSKTVIYFATRIHRQPICSETPYIDHECPSIIDFCVLVMLPVFS